MTHRRHRPTSFVLLTAAAIWAATALGTAAEGPDLLPTLKDYGSWARVNRAPYKIAPAVNVLCADPRAAAPSPHAGAFVDVYVNEAGRAAMFTQGNVAFPEGTIIVKEKRHTEAVSEPELLTVMVKRAKGYNPKVGDWEFAVVDGKATTVREQGRLARCMTCHENRPGSDFVFRTYLAAPE